MSTETLSAAYLPASVEARWQQSWADSASFVADPARVTPERPAYSIVIPPPNVTGILTLGHVLNNTIQDILARRARQEGKEVLWLPGMDHAGIATQTVVERRLRKESGLSRRDLGRDAFLAKVWEWKDHHGGIIVEQLKRLGCSCDWSRQRFTMDADYSRAVLQAFVDLHHDKMIYRGKRMVNWCPASLTALSDEEVIPKLTKSTLYTLRYIVSGQPDRALEVSTTRPETIMGDTAVAVHPDDPRYADLVGSFVLRPFPQAPIPVIADAHVDIAFGTGCLKVTPAHDKADFDIGLRHKLEILDILTADGHINCPEVPQLHGLERFQARLAAADMLRDLGLLVREEPYQNNVGHSERADVPIEPRLSEQWFLRYPATAQTTDDLRSGLIKFHPERWTKVFEHWMGNIQDWCISRQLWWGHRIPAWYHKHDPSQIHVSLDGPSDPENWEQDNDVLDTWFSSWLWPFATMDNSTLAKFYPTSDLVTGPDIIFFWVARMMMAARRFTNQIPFSNVFFTGIIRDSKGKKMSKSLGNSPDPLDLIATYGADGLRFGLLRIAPTGQDIRFDEKQIEEGRNFANKLWNAVRFRLLLAPAAEKNQVNPAHLGPHALDLLAKLAALETRVTNSYAEYNFSDIAQSLYDFFWADYCDWFLETAKPDSAPDAPPERRQALLAVMDTVLTRYLPLLHPFMPHLTEELAERLEIIPPGQHLATTPLPRHNPAADSLDPAQVSQAQTRVEALRDTVRRVRNLKSEYNLAARRDIRLIIRPAPDATQWLTGELPTLRSLIGAAAIVLDPSHQPPQGQPVTLSPVGEIYLPLEGLIDIAAEQARLDKEIAKTEKDLASTATRLQTPSFVERAPATVITEMQERLKTQTDRLQQLREMRSTL